MSLASLIDLARCRPMAPRLVPKAEITAAPPHRKGPPGQLRGEANEHRVLGALQRIGLPTWAAWVRLANAEEDARGIDVVLGRRHGRPAYLQVKSAPESARRFRQRDRARHGGLTIAVVIVDDWMGDVAIHQRCMVALYAQGAGRSG